MQKDRLSNRSFLFIYCLIQFKLAIGKRLRLSPAFPLLRTERASFPAFGGPSTDMY
jgi:hypothetical protein